jgi:hypothetical protein
VHVGEGGLQRCQAVTLAVAAPLPACRWRQRHEVRGRTQHRVVAVGDERQAWRGEHCMTRPTTRRTSRAPISLRKSQIK